MAPPPLYREYFLPREFVPRQFHCSHVAPMCCSFHGLRWACDHCPFHSVKILRQGTMVVLRSALALRFIATNNTRIAEFFVR